PRTGMPVEINALWYNAVMYSLELAKEADDHVFIEEWASLAEIIPQAFVETFWMDDKGYLADYVDGENKNCDVRPNMVFATSLPYTMLDLDMQKSILDVIEQELLTSRGLRTLSPENTNYKGVYFGDQATRDTAYHNGTAWPWLVGHFIEGYLKVNGKNGIHFAKKLLFGFEDVMLEHGIGTVSEVYDGDPPHKAGGTISQAWSVAELLRMEKMIEKL
ncbi:MAG: amylo-alpha-1,6-glucosidase, partial [Bacteroidales bacterium]|nr:amylo-alpha-1,6-glucosidase [Bacteroidales bacterium]